MDRVGGKQSPPQTLACFPGQRISQLRVADARIVGRLRMNAGVTRLAAYLSFGPGGIDWDGEKPVSQLAAWDVKTGERLALHRFDVIKSHGVFSRDANPALIASEVVNAASGKGGDASNPS
jgi:hypothetical protein